MDGWCYRGSRRQHCAAFIFAVHAREFQFAPAMLRPSCFFFISAHLRPAGTYIGIHLLASEGTWNIFICVHPMEGLLVPASILSLLRPHLGGIGGCCPLSFPPLHRCSGVSGSVSLMLGLLERSNVRGDVPCWWEVICPSADDGKMSVKL